MPQKQNRVTHEEDAEAGQTEALASKMAPQILGQAQIVGRTVTYMRTEGEHHVLVLDNKIMITLDGVVRMKEVADPTDVFELTGKTVHEHFAEQEKKLLGEGDDS